MNLRKIREALLLTVILVTFAVVNPLTIQALTQADNEAKEEIIGSLSKEVNSQYSQYKLLIAQKHDNSTVIIYNQSQAPPPPVVIPPPTNNNTQPPSCPPNQVYNQTTKQCQDAPVIPPPPPPPPIPTDKPTTTVNTSKFLRIVTVGDIDNNNGLTTQLDLAKKYHAQVFFGLGDYGYKSCQGVVDKIKAAGFTSANARIVQGNHDCDAVTKAFNGMSQLYGSATFASGKLDVFMIDGNSAFTCSSTQFKEMKGKIESSDAWYNIVGIHQPFATVKSDHSANGQFACWDPVFRANGVNPILQAHNHNYQRFDVNGLDYMVVGTGTHDSGSSMYPIDSNSWNGFNCLKCFTGTNGITLIDLQIDNKNVRNMQGWFISNADQVKDKFN